MICDTIWNLYILYTSWHFWILLDDFWYGWIRRPRFGIRSPTWSLSPFRPAPLPRVCILVGPCKYQKWHTIMNYVSEILNFTWQLWKSMYNLESAVTFENAETMNFWNFKCILVGEAQHMNKNEIVNLETTRFKVWNFDMSRPGMQKDLAACINSGMK